MSLYHRRLKFRVHDSWKLHFSHDLAMAIPFNNMAPMFFFCLLTNHRNLCRDSRPHNKGAKTAPPVAVQREKSLGKLGTLRFGILWVFYFTLGLCLKLHFEVELPKPNKDVQNSICFLFLCYCLFLQYQS